MHPHIEPFFDSATSTFSYVVHAGDGTPAAIVDSVLDYDPKSGRTSTASADRLIAFVRAHGLQVEWLLETHAHADHLSAAQYLKHELGGRIAIGDRICTVQHTFKREGLYKVYFHLKRKDKTIASASVTIQVQPGMRGPAQ